MWLIYWRSMRGGLRDVLMEGWGIIWGIDEKEEQDLKCWEEGAVDVFKGTGEITFGNKTVLAISDKTCFTRSLTNSLFVPTLEGFLKFSFTSWNCSNGQSNGRILTVNENGIKKKKRQKRRTKKVYRNLCSCHFGLCCLW